MPSNEEIEKIFEMLDEASFEMSLLLPNGDDVWWESEMKGE